MELKPSPQDIEKIIEKVELLWERTKQIRDQFPDSPKLIETAQKTPRSLFAKNDIDVFIEEATSKKPAAWENAEKELKAISRAKNEAWEQDIEPLRSELDLALAPYGDYFCSIGLGRVLKVLTLESIEFKTILQAEAIPERFHKILYAPQKDEYGFWLEKGTEKDVIEAIIHDLKRARAIAEKEPKPEPLQDKLAAIENQSSWHNQDFTSVVWYGIEYQFNKSQGDIVDYLWQNEAATEKKLGEIIETAADHYHCKDTFRSSKGYHCAWGKMIVNAGKGCFKLNKP